MGYIIKKIVYALITIYLILSLSFFLFQVMSPVDPLAMYLGGRGSSVQLANPEVRKALIIKFGLNKSLPERYARYMINTFTFNFGYSLRTQTPVAYELSRKIGPTLLLGGLALVVTALVGVSLGVLAATRRGGKVDVFTIGIGLLTWGVPSYFIQMLFLLVFSLILHWFPAKGMLFLPPPQFLSLDYITQVSYHIALPLITIVILGFGFFALYTRNMMLDTLTQDFIVTARAKGLKEITVVYKHALRATYPPILSMFVISIPMVFWLVIMAEIIFGWPGIGNWFLTSTMANDFSVVQAVVFLYSILILVGNLITDIIYVWADPRIRVGT